MINFDSSISNWLLKISQKKKKKDNHQNDSVYVHVYNTKGSV